MKSKELMDLPREEMAIRKVYQSIVKSGKLKVVFRPGNRVCSIGEGVSRCYWKDEKITLRIIEVPGSDVHKVAPRFSKSVKRLVKISSIEKINFSDIKASHFKGSSPDVRTAEQLSYHLGLVYGKTPEEVIEEGVTRIELEYLD